MYRVLVGKAEEKGSQGRPRRRWGIILSCIFRKWNMGYGLVRAGSG